MSSRARKSRCLRLALSGALLPGSLAAAAGAASAHAVGAESGAGWNSTPLIAFNLSAAATVYAYALWKLWRRSGLGHGVAVWRAAAFGAGVASLAAALLSRLDALSGELLSAHMIQHMILMNVAAPLLVLGAPALAWFHSLPRRWQVALASWRGPRAYQPRAAPWRPWLVWCLYAAALWVWHLPLLYQAALRYSAIHDLQHISLFAAAFLFWGVLLEPDRRRRLNRGLGVVYLFTTSLHAALLGVFMALAPRVWYGEVSPPAALWRLTAIEDQQLAGLIMWMPGCMVYAVAAAVLLFLWLNEPPAVAED